MTQRALGMIFIFQFSMCLSCLIGCAVEQKASLGDSGAEISAISVSDKVIEVKSDDAWLKTSSVRLATLPDSERCHIPKGRVLVLDDIKRDSFTRSVDLHVWLQKKDTLELCPSFGGRRDWYLFAGSYDPKTTQESEVSNGALEQTTFSTEEVVLGKPSGLDTDGHSAFVHTKDVSASNGLSEEEGRRLYFQGILPILRDKDTWNKAISQGRGIASAECALTNSAALETAGKVSGVTSVSSVFANQLQFKCTNQVERALRALGWFYYSKDKYRVPRGAVGVLGHESASQQCSGEWNNHTGHIFMVASDSPDLVSDNGGFNRKYQESTKGFWLPPGVYPQPR